ncbi:MAG: S8 family serine peptidase, partial [Deltaproteobacteria bacterium]|nr:S8 family serine peptidase [Deltaproteobacteria bacterium]
MTRDEQPRVLRNGLRNAALLIAASAAMATTAAGCGDDATPTDVDNVQAPINSKGGKGAKVDVMLRALQAKGVPAANAHKAMPKGLDNAKAGPGNNVTLVDVLIEGPPSSIPDLQQLGIKIRTVTSSGVMTASMPLHQLDTAATVGGVTRISAAKRVKMYNDQSNGTVNGTSPHGMNNARSDFGAGVIVGVIDSGLDWTHVDFRNGSNDDESRILYYWDQSDVSDAAPPGGLLDYGTVYTKADFDDYNINGNTAAVAESAKDTDGHGTHVTGTAAGDGSASGGLYQGVAPAADIIFVKFDFDGDRNSTAAI